MHEAGLTAAEAYFFQLALLISLIGFGLALGLIRLGNSGFLAVSIAILFMATMAVQFSWPHITRLSVSLVCLVLAFPGTREAEWRKTNVWLLCGALLLCYVRPEFVVSVFILSTLQIIYEPKRTRTWIVVAIAGILLLQFSPVSNNRSIIAFHQHYLYAKWLDGSFEGNPWTDSTGAFSAVFGASETLGQVIMANPGAFLDHILGNIERLPVRLLGLLRISGLIWAAFVVGSVLVLYRVRIVRVSRVRFIAVGAFILPSMIFSVLLFPRDHYLLQVLAPLFFLIPLSDRGRRNSQGGTVIQLIGLLLILYCIPWRSHPATSVNAGFSPGKRTSIHTAGCSNLVTIRKLNEIVGGKDFLWAPNETYDIYLNSQPWEGSISETGFHSSTEERQPPSPDFVFLEFQEAEANIPKVRLLERQGYRRVPFSRCGSALFSAP